MIVFFRLPNLLTAAGDVVQGSFSSQKCSNPNCRTLICLRRFSGLLCAIVGASVVMLHCAMPEKVKEVFGVGGLDEEDASGGEDLSSVFLDDLTISPSASEAQLVNGG